MGKKSKLEVYIVLVSLDERGFDKVGACYWEKKAATDEVERLNAANPHAVAGFVTRELDFPTFLEDAREDERDKKLERLVYAVELIERSTSRRGHWGVG